MASKGWGKLKSKLRDSDLDAEFEKFLNESLSDESLASPRRSITPKGGSRIKPFTSTKEKFEKPWWATNEDDEDSSVIEKKRRSWLKKEQPDDDTVDVDVDGDMVAGEQAKKDSLAMSRDSLDANGSRPGTASGSRPGTALDTILSEPEYSEDPSTGKSDAKNDQVLSSDHGSTQVEAAHVEEQRSSDSSFEMDNPSENSDQHDHMTITETPSTHARFDGKDTLDEMKDKDDFFATLEKGDDDVDYGKLNRDLDKKSSLQSSLQSSFHSEGFEVEGLQAYHPTNQTSDESSSHDESESYYTKRENEQHDGEQHNGGEQDSKSSPAQTSSKKEGDVLVSSDGNKENVVANRSKESASMNLLSKVALMESLDSTGGMRLAEKLEKLNQASAGNRAPNHVDKSITTHKISDEDQNTSTTVRTTVDFAEKLRNIEELSTQSFDHNINNDVQIMNDINKPEGRPIQSGMLMLDKDDHLKLPVNDFDLKPVVSVYSEEPKIAMSVNDTLNSNIKTQDHLNQVQTFSELNEAIASAIVNQYIDGQKQTPDDLGNDEESHSFSLQPINALINDSGPISDHYNDSDDGSPPANSLKSIKAIAEERKQRRRVIAEKSKNIQSRVKSLVDDQQKTPSKKKSKIINTPRKRTNIPSIQKNKEKTYSQKKVEKLNEKPPKGTVRKQPSVKTNPMTNTEELMTSIDILSSTLQDFQNNSRNDISVTRNSLLKDKDSHLSALHREQCLQAELRELRLLYDDAINTNERLIKQNKSVQIDSKCARDKLTLDYDKRIQDLHENLFVLKNKLQITENERDTASDLKSRDITELSKEDIEKLQKQLKEQEGLLNGYQQENERLYQDLKKRNAEKKKLASQMFEENQKLASEVGNLKEQLEQRPNSSPASLGASKIAQLNNQIKFYKTREDEHKLLIVQLENEVSTLKTKLAIKEKEGHTTLNEKELLQQLENVKSQHTIEVDKLNKKLKWYCENQKLLDGDLVTLNDKRNEIKELRVLVDRLESENMKQKQEKSASTAEKRSHQTKVQDLQRQIKEMEDIIRRRHPNSLPALIYAASAIPGKIKSYDSTDFSHKNVNTFLEKRIKQLEEELETRDKDNVRKVRAIEQRYNTTTIHYEDRIKQLEMHLAEYSNKLKTDKTVSEIEDDLSAQSLKYETLIEKLKQQLKEKQSKLTQSKLEVNNKKYDSKPDHSLKEITRLRSKLKHKEAENTELKATARLLRREKEALLNEREAMVLSAPPQQDDCDERTVVARKISDQTTSPLLSGELVERRASCASENTKLKGAIEALKLEMREKQLTSEASEAEMLSENRKLHERFTEQLKTIEESHCLAMEKLRMQFAVEHSNSKVAELNGKFQSYELMVAHYKGQVHESKLDKEKYEQSKITEDSLRRQISSLQTELDEATTHFTPEMHHYKSLQAKITGMENRHACRERELKGLLDNATTKAALQINYAEDKWRDILRNKDVELQTFREELDSIMEVLEELKRQGIMLPNLE